jgi:hypothetical protein
MTWNITCVFHKATWTTQLSKGTLS